MAELRVGGWRYPVRVYAAPRRQWAEVETVLGAVEERAPEQGGLDERFAGLGLFNGPVYMMTGLRVRGGLRMEGRRGWYYESMNTCELREMGVRVRRLARAIGIATLLAVREGGGYELMLGRVAGKGMGHRAGKLHVAPSGMMEPPWSVRENVEREMREEVGLEMGRLYLSGVAVNELNGRPEICTVCVVEAGATARLNGEFSGAVRVRLGGDEEMARALGLTPERIVPPGAAALFLGARLLRGLSV